MVTCRDQQPRAGKEGGKGQMVDLFGGFLCTRDHFVISHIYDTAAHS